MYLNMGDLFAICFKSNRIKFPEIFSLFVIAKYFNVFREEYDL